MSHKFLYEELKSADYDRYLLALFAPEKVRDGLVALFLLNHEIAKTRVIPNDDSVGWGPFSIRAYDGVTEGSTHVANV